MNSSQGKGIMRTGITSFAYFPISLANPKNLSSIYATAEEEVKAMKAKGIPGLSEQLDIQIEALRDPQSPDCELIAFPGLSNRRGEIEMEPNPKSTMLMNELDTGTPEPGKSYVSMFGMLNHPLSRGFIVCSHPF